LAASKASSESELELQEPYIEPLAVALVSAGQIAKFKVIPRMPDQSFATLHIDRLPKGASFEDNEDGTRTFFWQTTLSDQGEHIFRFTAIHSENPNKRVSAETSVIVGDPSAEGSRPKDYQE